jgi:hypothetical protein
MMTDSLTRLERREVRLETLLRLIAITQLAGPNPSVNDLTLAIERLEMLEATLASFQRVNA